MDISILSKVLIVCIVAHLIKWVLLKCQYKVCLFTNHHKDIVMFWDLIKKEKRVFNRFGYLLILLVYIYFSGSFVLSILVEIKT